MACQLPEVVSSDPRKVYRDRRDRLNDSEVRTLAELGRFRVIATHDLGLYVYGGPYGTGDR